jgi:signal transduction histidine kinase
LVTDGPSHRDAAGELAELRAERDALAAKLEDSQALLHLLYDQSPLAVGVVSIAEANYVYVNRAHCEFFQRPPEYYRTTDPYQVWMEISLPEELERERPLFQKVADGELDSYRMVKNFVVPGGATVPGELILSVSRDAAGRMHQLIAITRDLRDVRALEEEKRSLEAQLRRSQKLEMMGRMAGGVAHDFNNRLLIVMGYAELLYSELSEPRQRSYVDMIVSSAERSAELTQQLLAFSRRQVLTPKSLDVAEALQRVQRMLESWLSEKVQLQTSLGAAQRLWCDPGQLEQVILNLVINARDAMPDGGRLTLASRDVAPGSSELPDELSQGSFVALDVTDTGTGIPAEVLPHIFEPFYTTKAVGQGTGLGLSTVEGIVRQSGGHVRVRTREGQGTTISVYLPASSLAPEVAVAAPPLVAGSATGRQGTILVCDDDDAVRRLIGDVLAVGSFRVLAARSVAEALQLAAGAGKIDLVLTDIVMPTQSGPDLVQALRAQQPQLPVLYISGYADDKLLASIAGEELLSKPFRPAALLTRVRRLLDARAALSASAASAAPAKPAPTG